MFSGFKSVWMRCISCMTANFNIKPALTLESIGKFKISYINNKEKINQIFNIKGCHRKCFERQIESSCFADKEKDNQNKS